MSHKIAHELGRTYCAPQASRARKTRTNPLCCCSSLVFGRDPRVVVVPLRLASRIVPPIPVLGRVYRALCRKIPQIFLGRQKPRAFPSSDLARTFSSPPLFPCGSVVSCSPVVEKLPTNVPRLPPATPTLEAAEFGLIGIGYLLLLGPVIGIAWLYEDWGIRGYKPTQGIASPLGSTLVGYIAGFGALGTFARFVATISTNPAEIVGAILFLLLLFLPSCLWIANIFVGNHEPRMMSRLEKGDLAVKIPLKSFKIE